MSSLVEVSCIDDMSHIELCSSEGVSLANFSTYVVRKCSKTIQITFNVTERNLLINARAYQRHAKNIAESFCLSPRVTHQKAHVKL